MAVTTTSPPSSLPNRMMNIQYTDGMVPEKKVAWTSKWAARDIFYALFILFIHVLCLFAPSTFSWGAAGVAYVLYLLTGMFGVHLSYHRNLAHKSFKLPKFLEYLFAYFALHACQGDPMFWVSTHRYHHKYTDTERDPHSPVTGGLLFAHIGWLFDYNKMDSKGANYNNVHDLANQPYYRFLQKTMVLHSYLLTTLLYLIGGFPYVVWGMGVRIVCLYHIIFAINSICHTWGYQAWNTADNWWLCLLSFGESWHNNHHAFQYSARHGLEWWQIDFTWYAIKTLEYLGLATDLKLPSEAHKERYSYKRELREFTTEDVM